MHTKSCACVCGCECVELRPIFNIFLQSRWISVEFFFSGLCLYASSYFKSYAWFLFYWLKPYKIKQQQKKRPRRGRVKGAANIFYRIERAHVRAPSNSKVKSNIIFCYLHIEFFCFSCSSNEEQLSLWMNIASACRIVAAVVVVTAANVGVAVLEKCFLSLSFGSTAIFLIETGDSFSSYRRNSFRSRRKISVNEWEKGKCMDWWTEAPSALQTNQWKFKFPIIYAIFENILSSYSFQSQCDMV